MITRTRVALVIVTLVLAGCAHYHRELGEYRKAEPTPYYQKTLAWTKEHGEDSSTTPKPGKALAEHSQEDFKPEDRLEAAAAIVFGSTPEWIHDKFELMRGDTAASKSLSGTVKWEDLKIAIAVLNPSVKAARERWLATIYQYSQADFLEGLLREYGTFTKYLDIGAGKPLNKEMTQEFFPYPSLITLKSELIRKQVRLAELEWQGTLRDVLVETGSTFFDYQYQNRGLATVRENVRILEDLVNVVQERYRTGIASQADLLKAQTELERQKNLLKDFQSRMRSDAAQINAQLGRESNASLGVPGEADLPYDAPQLGSFTQQALQSRQEVLAQQSRVARTDVAIRLGEVMNRPLLTKGYSTLDRGMMAEGSEGEPNPPYGIQADTERLRPAYAQAESYLAEMRQRLQGEQEMLSQVTAQTQALARTSIENLDIAHRQFILVQQTVVPQNQSAYDIGRNAYTASVTSFLDLLDAERNLISSRLELFESRRNLNQAILRLATVRGTLGPLANQN